MGYGLRIGFPDDLSWIASQADSTWGNIPTAILLNAATVNPDLDPAVNPLYGGGGSPADAPWGLNKWPSICTAWNGACFDTVRGYLFMPNNGGHGDGPWAACMPRWDINREAPIWTRINNPPGATGATATSYASSTLGVPFLRYWADTDTGTNVNHWDMPVSANNAGTGIPRTLHTTNYSFYWQGKGPGNATEITISPSGGFDPTHTCGYILSETTGLPIATSLHNAALGGGGSFACADVDTTRGYLWAKSAGTYSYFVKWDGVDGHAYSNGSSADWYLSGASSLSYGPDLGLFLVGNGNSFGQSLTGSGFALLDPVTGFLHTNDAITNGSGGSPSAGPTWTGGESGQYASGLWPGECRPWWSVKDACWYAWDMQTGHTTKLMRIKHTSGANPRTGGWTISYMTLGGTNAVTPLARQTNGTYGQGFLWQRAVGLKDIFVVHHDVTDPGVFFKLP